MKDFYAEEYFAAQTADLGGFGPATLVVSAKGIYSLNFDTMPPQTASGQARKPGLMASLRKMAHNSLNQLEAYLRGKTDQLELPLDLRGTDFQIQVWQYLRSIRRGENKSYGEVAHALGHPKAARAVASACARNRIAVAVPCHRVVRLDGSPGGYRWGLSRKRRLLELEGCFTG